MKLEAAKIARPARVARGRKGRGGQRQRLIDACISALHLYGPSRTTVEKVVAIAKMSPGIVRFYFDSKAAMLVASLQHLAAEFEEKLLKPVSALASTPVAALELLVDLYLDPEIASPRKVSVWYAFWGEASSREEYYDICGQKDEGFAVLVRRLVAGLIAETGQAHLDPDAMALGLIGALEILWQEFAFRTEAEIDRGLAKRRCMAYLESLFPGQFPVAGRTRGVAPAADARLPSWAYEDARVHASERKQLFQAAWSVAGHESELQAGGDFLAMDLGTERVLVIRDDAGAVRAVRNSCPAVPHTLVVERAGRLSGRIECRWHGVEFGLDGRAPAGAPWPDLRALGLLNADGLLFVRPRAALPVQADADFVALQGGLSGDLRWPGIGEVLPRVPLEIAVAADWKVLVEQWLDLLPREAVRESDPSMDACAWDFDPAGGEWSRRRYAALVDRAPAARWQRRFLAPHQLFENRPDGLSVLMVVPVAAGRSVLRRLEYTRVGPEARARAATYLAGRVDGFTRRRWLEAAESTQKGMIKFGHAPAEAGARASASAWFRAWLTARLPACADPACGPANHQFEGENGT